jgi:3-mercaptopyruvate sulfurtransferase SseA
VALLLRKRGVSRIRPLAGGFEAWQAHRFPVEPLELQPSRALAG